MVCRNLYQTHLQEVDLMHIPVNHVRVKDLKLFVQPLNESQGPSQLHGRGPWLMCDVALSGSLNSLIGHVIESSTSSS